MYLMKSKEGLKRSGGLHSATHGGGHRSIESTQDISVRGIRNADWAQVKSTLREVHHTLGGGVFIGSRVSPNGSPRVCNLMLVTLLIGGLG